MSALKKEKKENIEKMVKIEETEEICKVGRIDIKKFKNLLDRKFNKDCIMKKIKSRFFKFYINKYVVVFCNYMNFQTVYPLQHKIYFSRLRNYFVKDATIKRHREWKLTEKSILEIFFEYSDMKLGEVINLYKNNEELLSNILKRLDKNTKFIMLQPFKDVFNSFIENKELLQEFISTVKKDIQKKKKKDDLFKDDYCLAYEYNIKEFINYYSCNKEEEAVKETLKEAVKEIEKEMEIEIESNSES